MSSQDVVEYMETLEEPRRSELQRLHRLIREEAPDIPDAEVKLWDYSGKLIGYGDYHYKGKSTEGDWFLIGLAARKAHVSLYSMALTAEGTYYARDFAPELGVKSGNSCLNLKRPNDLPEDKLREFVRESVRLMRERGALNQTSAS